MKRAVFVPVGVLAALGTFLMMRALSQPRSRGAKPALERSTGETRVPAGQAPAVSVGPSPNRAAAKEKAPAGGQGRKEEMARPFEYQAELSSYLDLHEKVFLSDHDKARKAELLRHSGLLKALGGRLLEATRSADGMDQQDAAIDLLVEALKEGDTDVASQVLRDVVQDRQIEDNSLDKSAREQLAGLKAEVLYQWSAVNPSIASNLERWLPGPVSHKIWANVLRMQQNNQAE